MSLAKGYLVLYNVVMFLGWSGLLAALVAHITIKETHVGVYDKINILLYIFQTGAVLEIVHAAVGLVRSNVLLTGFQVFSRVFLVWGIAYSVPEIQNTIAVPLFLVAWCITEVIRYAYYAFGLLGSTPEIITWCRYTFFIILYPVGVTGELLAIYWSLPYLKKSGIYSLLMPNCCNIAFDYYVYCIITMFLYIPIFPQLYLHMFAQRKKIISDTKKTQ